MKKITALILTVLMLVTMLSTMCFAAADIAIKVNPAVFLCGEIYNVVWSTTSVGTGYVEYTYNGKQYKVYDEEGGIVRTDDYIHTVSIPVEHLDAAGSYKVTSVYVSSRTPHKVTYGGSCSVTRSFKGYQGEEEINIWCISDTHRNATTYKDMTYVHKATSYLKGGTPDLVTMNGDIANDMPNKDHWEIGVLDQAVELSGGTIPVVYARGNHETRGMYAGYFLQYLPSDTGEFYFQFEYGPMSSIVLDYGEDKIDTHYEYSGLVDYKNYRREQTEWLETIKSYTGDPTYRIAFCHGPDIKNNFGYNWSQNLSDMGTDLQVAGHSHNIKIDEANKTATEDFPVLHDGGHGNNHTYFVASQLILKDGNIEVYAVDNLGEVKLERNITAGTNVKTGTGSAAPEKSEDASVPTAYGAPVSTVLKGASADFAFITKPTVFDTGNTYTVAWATTEGKNSMGEVYVEIDGVSYRYTDSESGTLRTQSNVHAVRIPRSALEESSGYTIVSQHIIEHGAYKATKGNTVSSGKLTFTGYHDQEEINMLFVSDLNSSSAAVTRAKGVASDYDMLVLGGNTINTCDSSTTVATNLLYNTGILTSGKIPVTFVRGENETLGEFAPYLTRVIRNSTRQFYDSIEYGPISALVVDTSGIYDDDSSEYNSLVSFDPVFEKQLDWIKESSYGNATYKLVFTRVGDMNSIANTNYVRYLNTLGTDLAVSSHGETASITALGGDRNFVSITDGSYAKDGNVGTLLTFKNGVITAKLLGEGGKVMQTSTITATDNDNVTYSDVDTAAWYADAVNYTALQRSMIGTSDTTYEPTAKLTRAMAVTVLARLAGVTDSEAETPFTDVMAGAYYEKAVNWAYESGVVLGTSATTFSPDRVLTREELVTLLYRMYGDTIDKTNDNVADFYDIDTVSEFAKEAVTVMSKAGIVNGVGNNTFASKNAVTRAELAQILYNSKF